MLVSVFFSRELAAFDFIADMHWQF